MHPRQGQREEHFAEDMPFMGQGLGTGKKVTAKRQAETLPQAQVSYHLMALRSMSPSQLLDHEVYPRQTTASATFTLLDPQTACDQHTKRM